MDLITIGSIALQVGGLIIFILLIWPHVRDEEWKKKFIKNKLARSLLIIFILIMLMSIGAGLYLEAMLPVDEVY